MNRPLSSAAATLIVAFGSSLFASPASAGAFAGLKGPASCQLVHTPAGTPFRTRIRVNGPLYTVGRGAGCDGGVLQLANGSPTSGTIIRLANGMTCRGNEPRSVWCGN